METKSKTHFDLCVGCGKPVPEGQMICDLCKKVNNRSAANWLARQLAMQKAPEKQEGSK